MIIKVYRADGTNYELDVNVPEFEPEPIPEPETEDDVWAELDAAYQEGVDSI